MIAALAWRNIWRQPQRTLLSLAGIVFTGMIMVFLLALQVGSYDTMENNVLRLFDGFAQIQPPSYADDPDLRKQIADPATLAARVTQLPQVTAVAPRAQSFVILSAHDRSYGAALVGVDPEAEPHVSSIAALVRDGRYLTSDDSASILLGAALARDLQVGVGDVVTLLGAGADGSVAADVLTVAGIYNSGVTDLDRQIVEIPLSRFQEDFGLSNAVNTVAISGASLNAIQDSLGELRRLAATENLVLLDWTQLQPALADAILLDASISLLWYGTLLIVVVFIILNTLLMSVLERTREFGMLLAIGMGPGQIGRMIWLELILLAVIGALLAMVLGGVLTAVIARFGISFPSAEDLFAQWGMPAVLQPSITLFSVCLGPLAIALGIVIAGIVPYRRVLRLEPVSAMRAI